LLNSLLNTKWAAKLHLIFEKAISYFEKFQFFWAKTPQRYNF